MAIADEDCPPRIDSFNLEKDLVTIVVGAADELETFYLHEDVARAHSPFLAAALRGDWKESEERIISLPECGPELFRIFAHFAYTGKMPSCVSGQKTKAFNGIDWESLCECWLLGDVLLSDSFRDFICDAISDQTQRNRRYPLHLHRTTYPWSSGNNGLKRLLVDIAAWGWNAEAIGETEIEPAWTQFFRDLAVRQSEIARMERKDRRRPPYSEPSCLYHEHTASKKPCYKDMKFPGRPWRGIGHRNQPSPSTEHPGKASLQA